MKVCVLGSGLASLTLAKGLINHGIKVDLICKHTHNNYDKSQTLGISQSNIDFFNKKILNIDSLLWNINEIEIFSDNLNNENIIKFENKKKQLFSIIKNYKLFNYLLAGLKKSKLFKIKKNKKIISSNKEYNLIINLDYNHPITKKLFYKRFSKSYNSYGHVTIIKHKRLPSNDIAVQIFTKKGPIAFLPISKSETSIVYSARGKKKIGKNELHQLINEKLKKYEIKKINDFKSFELKSLDLRNYYYENILAFGDLLHRLHPLAGQGFNMTIRDTKLLLELINSKIKLGIQLDSSICSEFEKKAKPHNYLFSNGIDFIYEFFNFESKTKTKLMSKSVQFLGKNKFINRLFTKFADTGTLN